MIQMCMLEVFSRSFSTKRAHKIKEVEDFGQNPNVQSAVLKVPNIQTQNGTETSLLFGFLTFLTRCSILLFSLLAFC